MKKAKVISDFALAGGIATKYYVNPPATQDIDFYVIVESAGIDFMAPVYAFALKEGAAFIGQHLFYDGKRLDILPAYNDLTKEAVENKIQVTIVGIKVPIITPDYLYFIAKQVGRMKDKERMKLLYPFRSKDFISLYLKHFGIM